MTDKASIAIDLIETQCSVYEDGKRYCVFCSKVCYPPGLEKHKNTCPIHIVSIVKTAAEERRKLEKLEPDELVSRKQEKDCIKAEAAYDDLMEDR